LGTLHENINAEFEILLQDFFNDKQACNIINISGDPIIPISLELEQLHIDIKTMAFFDRLYEKSKN
jgi:hypothetical protein